LLPKSAVRRLDPSWINALLAIESKNPGSHWDYDLVLDSIERRDSFVCGCISEGKLDGFAIARSVADDGQILALGVDYSKRRSGIGRKLLSAIREEFLALGMRQLSLEVRESNLAAIGLYQSFGFREAGKRPSFYTNPTEAAIVMILRLNESL
jgi:ribosomal-protein-alanine N-acetyltransferase